MNLSRFNPRYFWSTESGLTALLVFTLVYLIILTTLSDVVAFGSVMTRLFFSLVVVAGVLTTFKQKWLHGVAIALAVAVLAINVVERNPAGDVLWPSSTPVSALCI